jgi:serine/threonine protein kinase
MSPVRAPLDSFGACRQLTLVQEVVKQLPYTSKADIWVRRAGSEHWHMPSPAQSIGSVVLEMLTGSHPYPNLSQMQALFRVRFAYISCRYVP